MGKNIYVTLLIFLSLNSAVFSQSAEIPFYTSDQLDLDITKFTPLRAEYQERFFTAKSDSGEISGYILFETAKTQMWGEPNIMFDWSRQGVGATASDVVITDLDFAIKTRLFPSSGTPGGVIIENHYYGNRADVIYTNPNFGLTSDTTTFSFSSSDKKFKYNTIYTHEKKYRRVHNVIVWPFLLAAIDWEKHDQLILPGFSPFGMVDFLYRLIDQGEVIFEDAKGRKHKVRKIIGIRTNEIEKLRSTKLSDPVPRIAWYVSKYPPYYYGNIRSAFDEDGNEIKSMSETLVGFQKMDYSYSYRMKEMLNISRDFLRDRDIDWVDWIEEEKNE